MRDFNKFLEAKKQKTKRRVFIVDGEPGTLLRGLQPGWEPIGPAEARRDSRLGNGRYEAGQE